MEEEKISELDEIKDVNVSDLEKEKEELTEKKNEVEKKRKNGKVRRLITDIIISVLFIIIVFEIIIGMVNMQKMHNHEKPVWYLNKYTKTYEEKEETIYNLGLYRIIESKYLVKTDEGPKVKETQIFLKPFFYD